MVDEHSQRFKDAVNRLRDQVNITEAKVDGDLKTVGHALLDAEVLAVAIRERPLSGRQGTWRGAAESRWWPVHSRGWLDSHFRIVSSSDMQFQTQRRNYLQDCCQLRIARRG